jgi:hypothetical protein
MSVHARSAALLGNDRQVRIEEVLLSKRAKASHGLAFELHKPDLKELSGFPLVIADQAASW